MFSASRRKGSETLCQQNNYCLVTGAAGFIGSHLVDALLAKGCRVDGLDDYSLGTHEPPTHKQFEFLRCRDADVKYRRPRKWDTIFHCAAWARIQPSLKHPAETVVNNVAGTAEMLTVARDRGARFIYAGSSTCDGDAAANPYALSKHMGEDLCRMYSQVYGVRCAIARFYNVYGPRQIEEGPYATAMGIWEKAYREGRPLPMCGTGQKRRDWTHVDDIVAGLIAVGDWLGANKGLGNWVPIFPLGRGKSISVAEVLAMFGGDIKHLPDRPGEAERTLANIEYSMAHLEWTPTRNLADYISERTSDAA